MFAECQDSAKKLFAQCFSGHSVNLPCHRSPPRPTAHPPHLIPISPRTSRSPTSSAYRLSPSHHAGPPSLPDPASASSPHHPVLVTSHPLPSSPMPCLLPSSPGATTSHPFSTPPPLHLCGAARPKSIDRGPRSNIRVGRPDWIRRASSYGVRPSLRIRRVSSTSGGCPSCFVAAGMKSHTDLVAL
jgi:hypothetical protein